MATSNREHPDLGLSALERLAVVPAPEWLHWNESRQSSRSRHNGERPAHITPSADTSNTPSSPQSPLPNALSEAERKYLRAVLANPGRASSEYPKLAGIGTHRAQALRQHLVEQGYLREQALATNIRGRTAIVLEPLPAALEVLKQDEGGGA